MGEKESGPLAYGDVVKLKSGGPKMTVNALPTSSAVECVWFFKDAFQRATLNNTSLVRA